MKFMHQLSKILTIMLFLGIIVNPTFCEKHHTIDFCFMEEEEIKGGNTPVED